MPYKEEPLSKEEIDILTQWIKEGAEWGDHWAYLAPKTGRSSQIRRHYCPGFSADVGWLRPKNEIDYFILEEAGTRRT